MKLRRIAAFGPAFVVALALLALWEVYVRSGIVTQSVLPSPLAVVQALVDRSDALFAETVQTLLETLLGIVVATVLGLLLALALGLSSLVRQALYPLLVVSQTVPLVALAPLLLIWFGYDIQPKIVLVTLYCFFPITVACADALLSVDPDLIRLLQSMRASNWQILWMVRLPAALPAFFSGLRIAATYSVTGAIVGEYVGAERGLGIYMVKAVNAHATAAVFAAIVITSLLSLFLFVLVSFIERLALPWHQRTLPGKFGQQPERA
ncbi:ABC-type nitrate/sulfonate/bicarbonate transport system permease component [Thermosporothrix hazakensis]|jgi:ABC-type nitrate/sulfonate/bicarbonate transport system permease component|uniref:ABC-type nitrate/sulfonate/bicarbonate transport system permease component n=2 Tax=Thermosporothrix TaxID=768650 RepID=A0A326UF12_THEHA|nr:ABC transporter permease [Thermosporothrix hazakensis]PZW36624.1 ABC-type nitrate/sulfonate/bicarbonate transport system permease component [Thermosporothrix hazakensis]BBH89092.1 ABC transporter permease [Thermosporothrix sp. COM3]GCE47275.1 ABC transporter permease [Thermosporothrix hazakensis]